MQTRPSKADAVVVGEGPAALTAALRLAGAGLQVALLAEAGWAMPPGPATWPAVRPAGDAETPASLTLAMEAGWQEARRLAGRYPEVLVPGEARWVDGDVRVSAIDVTYGRFYAALAADLQAAGAEVVQTRVRGISVIEGQVLGVVSDAARWDARQVVVASEGAGRALALSRMAHPFGDPISVATVTRPLRRLPDRPDGGYGEAVAGRQETLAGPDGLCWRAGGAVWLLGELPTLPGSGRAGSLPEHVADVVLLDPVQPLPIGASRETAGLWYACGTAGRLLLALGAAVSVTREML